MDIKFLGQPILGDDQLGKVIHRLLANPAIGNLTAVSAWAKASGLGRLKVDLEAFAARGGTSELIVGIDEGGATKEGLSLALDLFSVVRVFHDPGTRTFHPKIYVARGTDLASVTVGSSNLTKGGLYTNYEASLLLELDLTIAEPDSRVFEEVESYIASLRAMTANCLVLDRNILSSLATDPRYRISAESAGRGGATGAIPSGAESPMTPNIFGNPIRGLAGAPTRAPSIEAPNVIQEDALDSDSVISPKLPNLQEEPTQGASSRPARSPASAIPATPAVTAPAQKPLRFWKALSNFDVSRTSAPGQMIIPIQFRPFFEPFVVQVDKASAGGVRQSENVFPATFIEHGNSTVLPETRAIIYEPAAGHPRQNIELRYTMLNRALLLTLHKDEILVFERDANGAIQIELRPAGTYAGRFAWI